MNTYFEKRRALRVNVDLQTVFLGPSLDIEKTVYAQIKNISSTGGYLVSRNTYNKKPYIQMRFVLPVKKFGLSKLEEIINDDEDILITCKAKIVRRNKRKSEHLTDLMFGMGIEFIEIGKEDMKTLEEFINSSNK